MKLCPSCSCEKEAQDFSKDKTRKDGLARSCKPCMKEYRSSWLPTKTAAERAQMKADVRLWGKQNHARKQELDRKYRKSQRYKDAQNNYLKRWRPNNKHAINAINAARRAALKNAVPTWFEHEKVKEVYQQAAELSSVFGVQLEVDHIIPIVSDTVCGLHCWHNLQVLEKGLNLQKTNKYQQDW